MLLHTLRLNNFRSYQKQEFTFTPRTTVIVGSNASGKTNVLEAIFFLATGKSFRAEKEREMISFEKEIGRVKGEVVDKENEKLELEIVVTTGEMMGEKIPGKKFSVNGVGKRMIDFIGNLRVVLFWPQDLELVTDSPSLRRRYLDFVLIQVDREYRRTLHSFERGLRQRNSVLEAIRDHGAHRHQLMFWDQLLIKSGNYITGKRKEYIEFLNHFQPDTMSNPFNFRLYYDASIISQERLKYYEEAEFASAMTLVGPHRDDFTFKIQTRQGKTKLETDRDLSHFGSRGEQRLAILWLKLGELAYIKETSGEKPLLLLDDIYSELDRGHRKIISDVIGNQQTVLTTTDMHFIEKDITKDIELIELS